MKSRSKQSHSSTPRRPKDSGIRQQTQPDQSSQSGVPHVDREFSVTWTRSRLSR